MLEVALKDIRIHTIIGCYPEEEIIPNTLVFNIHVYQSSTISNLPYIDYSVLYRLVQESVQEPVALIESLIQRIHHAILAHYPSIDKMVIRIAKLNPPMGGEIAASEIAWHYESANNK
jgi:dihydroneopterin aldolase